MRRLPVLLIGAVLATTAVVIGEMVLGGPHEHPPTQKHRRVVATRLADVDTTSLTVPRAAFCDSVDPTLTVRALGLHHRHAIRTLAYRNGQPAPLTDKLDDVAHEFGCAWTAGAAQARAWIFAPPVPAGRAAVFVRDAKAAPGCRALHDAATFGDPSIALLCSPERGRLVSYRGLFGDAWLTCTLSARLPERQVAVRADHWCAAVALAAAR